MEAASSYLLLSPQNTCPVAIILEVMTRYIKHHAPKTRCLFKQLSLSLHHVVCTLFIIPTPALVFSSLLCSTNRYAAEPSNDPYHTHTSTSQCTHPPILPPHPRHHHLLDPRCAMLQSAFKFHRRCSVERRNVAAHSLNAALYLNDYSLSLLTT